MINLLAYPRSILMTLLYPIVLFFYCLVILIFTFFYSNRRFNAQIVYYWGLVTCWMFGVNVRVEGRENIPNESCLYLFNHTSFFDIFALASVIPGIFFGGKAELFKIPLFGRLGKQFGMISIPRENREEAIKALNEAIDRFNSGDQFALAPEGRRMSEEKLGSFKSGPFVLAITGKIPIVPVVIKNASFILPKNSWFPNWGKWKQDIVLTFEKPISTQNYKIEDKQVLKDLVRSIMLKYLPSAE